jgi:excisionase family DNA binding protein
VFLRYTKKGVFMGELIEKARAQLHDVETVMERLGVGRLMVFELIATNKLRSVKVGRRRLVSESALCDFIERLDGTHGYAA